MPLLCVLFFSFQSARTSSDRSNSPQTSFVRALRQRSERSRSRVDLPLSVMACWLSGNCLSSSDLIGVSYAGLIGDVLLNIFLAVTVSAGTELHHGWPLSLLAPAAQCRDGQPQLLCRFFRSQELRHLSLCRFGSI